ncbi:MAG: hypothetical protein ABIV94_00370 [Acidimicrobiales bacterium]
MVRRLITVGLVAAVLAVTGCSGGTEKKVASLGKGETSSSSSDSGNGKQSFEDAQLSFAQCMRDHGVDMPDPTFNEDGSTIAVDASVSVTDENTPATKAANEACLPIMDAAIKDLPKPSPEEEAKMRDDALKFAKCMRDHGVDMPDPTFDDKGAITIEAPAGVKPDVGGTQSVAGPDPAFLDAAKACAGEGGGGFRVGPALGPETASS